MWVLHSRAANGITTATDNVVVVADLTQSIVLHTLTCQAFVAEA